MQPFLSTPSARRATDSVLQLLLHTGISIHALREEGDHLRGRCPGWSQHFYPRPPRGGRQPPQSCWIRSFRFLSTPSARRATTGHLALRRQLRISIHALREEGDVGSTQAQTKRSIFLSTPSARRATAGEPTRKTYLWISIHALREEGDLKLDQIIDQQADFYPRPPRGGRPSNPQKRNLLNGFLSTPSARRATSLLPESLLIVFISIHALREEGDGILPMLRSALLDFYPRPPRGGRPSRSWFWPSRVNFYPRPPRGGRPGLE